MATRNYSSFKEIDQRLKILWLQKEIDHENIKLGINRSKENLYPGNLMKAIDIPGGLASFWQNIIITFIANKLYKKFVKKDRIEEKINYN